MISTMDSRYLISFVEINSLVLELLPINYSACLLIGFYWCIVRPVKRDWAVLSKDTPMDMSILKSARQSVFIHL